MQDIFYVSEMPDITECEGNDLTWYTLDSRSVPRNFNKIVNQAAGHRWLFASIRSRKKNRAAQLEIQMQDQMNLAPLP